MKQSALWLCVWEPWFIEKVCVCVCACVGFDTSIVRRLSTLNFNRKVYDQQLSGGSEKVSQQDDTLKTSIILRLYSSDTEKHTPAL